VKYHQLESSSLNVNFQWIDFNIYRIKIHHQMHTVDFTKLFSIIDSIVCALIECTDESNTIYFITVGYIGNQIVLKLDSEDDVSIYRFEMTSPRKSMEKVAWIIEERGLVVKIVTYHFDGYGVNMTSDFYMDNVIMYTFKSRGRSSESIKVSYTIHFPDNPIDYQELCDNYNSFLQILRQNERGMGITEVLLHPNRFLRKSKLQDLLDN